MTREVLVCDAEGVLAENDNAFEVTSNYVPHGDKLFSVLSSYDDVLADVVKKPDYNAGDTLKLILPFLKAYDVTDAKMRQFSSETVRVIKEAGQTLKNIRKSIMDPYIVSTSYHHYVKALCDAIDFPFENTYSTFANIDNYGLSVDERIELQELSKEIAGMPVIKIKGPTPNHLSEEDRRNVKRLDDIIWEEIYSMDVGRAIKEVKTIGGHEKANAVEDIVRKEKTELSQVMYVGDSITDEEAFKLVREAGGLAVSFNGNNYAVRSADIGIISDNVAPIEFIARGFLLGGKERAKKSVNYKGILSWAKKAIVLTDENMKQFSEDSCEFRKKVRGINIGKLG